MTHDTTNIFISYGRKDGKELAVRLRDNLLALGYGVWLDLEEIPGGANWSTLIEDAIEHSDIAICLLSHASYASQWCRAEQLRAIRKGKRLIPLLVQPDAEIPLHLEHLNYLDFSKDENYQPMFRDLLSDINAGQAFRRVATPSPDESSGPFKRKKKATSPRYEGEKQSAPSLRRAIKELQNQAWLGARFWWPYFLFHVTDIHTLTDVLVNDRLSSPFERGEKLSNRWDKHVRLYFRPRTPNLFRAEGFKPADDIPPQGAHMPIPVYLLFDLEAIICHPDSKFSEGDPAITQKTGKTPAFFRELPFEQIYHDTWFMPDERIEIMRCREAQVLIPKSLGLEALQIIWLRSVAEYETLHDLLPEAVWHKWHDKITARTDYHLFNHKRPYVRDAILGEQEIRLRFNTPPNARNNASFNAHATLTNQEQMLFTWEDDALQMDNDLVLTLPQAHTNYALNFYLDGALAYSGTYEATITMF